MPKPVHPAVVHFPIAFLSLSFGLDIIHRLTPALPQSWSSSLAVSTDLTRLSYFLLSAGLLTAIPSLVTGVREAVVLIAKQGMYETDASGYGVQMRTKMKALIAHAVANDIVMGLTLLVWMRKRAAAAQSLQSKMGMDSLSGMAAVAGAAAYEPKLWMVVLETVLLAGLMMAANIGGSLTYIFGIGFAAGGSGASKKKA